MLAASVHRLSYLLERFLKLVQRRLHARDVVLRQGGADGDPQVSFALKSLGRIEIVVSTNADALMMLTHINRLTL